MFLFIVYFGWIDLVFCVWCGVRRGGFWFLIRLLWSSFFLGRLCCRFVGIVIGVFFFFFVVLVFFVDNIVVSSSCFLYKNRIVSY